MSYAWGQDPTKWVIEKYEDAWIVYPPLAPYGGSGTFHETSEEAFAEFRRKTAAPAQLPEVPC